jgi:hypothetical protein
VGEWSLTPAEVGVDDGGVDTAEPGVVDGVGDPVTKD